MPRQGVDSVEPVPAFRGVGGLPPRARGAKRGVVRTDPETTPARHHDDRGAPEAQSKTRLLIFVIAYFAEKTLTKVLDRIPRAIFEDFDCEILVVDDASTDRTFELGCEYKAANHPAIRITVLRNELNQGYGGNQKVGYAYAIAGGFDVVAMVHGDGQYAPEELPTLVRPLRPSALAMPKSSSLT